MFRRQSNIRLRDCEQSKATYIGVRIRSCHSTDSSAVDIAGYIAISVVGFFSTAL